jgi:Ca2+-binding EF-hand superfamily protein
LVRRRTTEEYTTVSTPRAVETVDCSLTPSGKAAIPFSTPRPRGAAIPRRVEEDTSGLYGLKMGVLTSLMKRRPSKEARQNSLAAKEWESLTSLHPSKGSRGSRVQQAAAAEDAEAANHSERNLKPPAQASPGSRAESPVAESPVKPSPPQGKPQKKSIWKNDPEADLKRQNNVDALRVASQYRIGKQEVVDLLRHFREFDGEKGAVTRAQFRRVLEKFLEAGVSDALLDSAWRAVGGDQSPLLSNKGETMIMWEAQLDAFCAWYIANMFGQVAQATQSQHDALVMSLAEKCKITPLTAEKLKVVFDSFDTDKSGVIEYGEFVDMLAILLKITDWADLPSDRVARFWKEIDQDESGEVEFIEFGAWYLKYFSPESVSTSVSIDKTGIIGKFYSSYDPSRQRASFLEQFVGVEKGIDEEDSSVLEDDMPSDFFLKDYDSISTANAA